jgi:type II secretion system protein H
MFWRQQLRSSEVLRKNINSPEAGFTLIELLVAIAILAIVLGLAVLTIPNHDARYWRENLDQLVSSLNLAQEESAMSGMPMLVQIDSIGWRFSKFTPNGMVMPAIDFNPNSNSQTFVPDVYKPQLWHQPVQIAATQITLGGEIVTQVLQIPIAQEQRQAVIARARNGRFSWNAGALQ